MEEIGMLDNVLLGSWDMVSALMLVHASFFLTIVSQETCTNPCTSPFRVVMVASSKIIEPLSFLYAQGAEMIDDVKSLTSLQANGFQIYCLILKKNKVI